jgi:hypothetical protein
LQRGMMFLMGTQCPQIVFLHERVPADREPGGEQ